MSKAKAKINAESQTEVKATAATYDHEPVAALEMPAEEVAPLPPSEDQVKFLVAASYDEDFVRSKTRRECFEKIREIIAYRRAQAALPPTDPQLRYLERKGYRRDIMRERTRGYCRSLIFKIKRESGELTRRAS